MEVILVLGALATERRQKPTPDNAWAWHAVRDVHGREWQHDSETDEWVMNISERDLIELFGEDEPTPRVKTADAKYIETDGVYVNVFHVERAYGGPEEGGWWYDHSEIKASVACSLGMADEIAEKLREAFGYLDDPQPISNVRSRGKLNITIDDLPGESTEPPHYC